MSPYMTVYATKQPFSQLSENKQSFSCILHVFELFGHVIFTGVYEAFTCVFFRCFSRTFHL